MSRCFYCYQFLGKQEVGFHAACAKKMFGHSIPPLLPYTEADIETLAQEVIKKNTTITGVQAKLSLHISGKTKSSSEQRFTIVGLWGGYILKPANKMYSQLPQVEDLTMHLAQLAQISTAQHCLIPMQSGNLAYLTKRMDRFKKTKLAMEDMCQLTERLTEDKYRGSYEQIGKTIEKFSATPKLDVVNFFEVVVFSFLTGNADMHLKNFSLLEHPKVGMTLSPAYDLINTTLVNPADEEEMALTINGKKKKLKLQDFLLAMTTLRLSDKQQANIFNKMATAYPKWMEMINSSFLDKDFKKLYKSLIDERMKRLSIK